MSPWELGKKRNRQESAVLQYFEEDTTGRQYLICQVKLLSETEIGDDLPGLPKICSSQIKIAQSGEKDDSKSTFL